MKSITNKLLGLFILLLITVIFVSFQTNSNQVTAANKFKAQYKSDLILFENSIYNLQSQVRISTNMPDEIATSHKLFLEARNAYKKIEFLLEYLDPGHAENFNGGNLIKGDDNILSTQQISPKGLQVIESLVFEDNLIDHKEEIDGLCSELLADINLLEKNIVGFNFDASNLIEACRKQIIRICFLGITGFDSPVAKNSLPEAIVSLTVLRQICSIFAIETPQHELLHQQLNSTLSDAMQYLNSNQNFNSFNRLFFIREYGNTIYALLLDLHIALDAQLPQSKSTFNLPVNYEVRNFFEPDFLNASFYNVDKIDTPSPEKIYLGKILFFDPVLSINNQRACASCHNPKKAFTDGLAKSTTTNFTGTVNRNAPTLINAVFQAKFFYDLRADFPETQIDHVVFNVDEFNSNYEGIIEKLKLSPQYIALFQKAFPDQPADAINGFTITKAIADYVRSLVALNSPFDKYMSHQSDTISESVKNGFNLFMGKANCGTCHFPPTFYGTVPPNYVESESEVVTIPSSTDTINAQLDTDLGRYNIQNVEVYKHAFKTPTVRNIQLTSPYMHNGVYETLEEVMDFYNKGGGAGLGIKVEHQTLAIDPLLLTKTEIENIIDFMKSLTDTIGITAIPNVLPQFPTNNSLNNRKIGGEY